MENNEEIVLSDQALVSETDENGLILYANKDFCEVSECKMTQIIGRTHNIFTDDDMPKEVFESLWKPLKEVLQRVGLLKTEPIRQILLVVCHYVSNYYHMW